MKLKHLFIVLLIVSCTAPKFQKEQDAIEGDYAFYYKNLKTGETLKHQENEIFHAASTMKIPVMMQLFHMQNKGEIRLRDSVKIYNTFQSIIDQSEYQLSIDEDSEGELYNQIGKQTTYMGLIKPMIQNSSNLATNILIDVANPQNTNAYIQTLGAQNTLVLRGVEDQKAFDLGKSNTTTASDLAILMETLAKNQVPNSPEMIEILCKQEWNDLIPRFLPQNLKIAHKTGAITGVHHDAAIVYPPGKPPYILVIMSKNLKDFDQGTIQLAELAKAIHNYHISK